MADKELCGDVVKYTNRVVTFHRNRDHERMIKEGFELFEILALNFATQRPTPWPLKRLAQEQHEFQSSSSKYQGLDHNALCGAPRSVIPLLVAYELDRLGIQLEPQVGWGVWLNDFHALTGMIAQPHDA